MPDIVQSAPLNVPWYHRAGIWIGIATSPGALIVGGGLAARLPLTALFLAIPIGASILTALTVTQGIISRRRRETLPRRAIFTFGTGFGANLLNLVMVFSTFGWVSFHLGIAGFSLATLLSLSAWVGVLLLVGSALVLNEMGLNRWNVLVWLTTISALGAALVALSVVEPKPIPPSGNEMGLSPLLWGIGSVVSYSLVFAVRSSDFTWDMKSDLDVVKDGLAYLLPVLIMIGIGVTLYRITGESNLADILAQTSSAGLGHVFLVLAVISPILTNFHSGALALEGLVPVNKRLGALLIAAVGFILGATRFDHHLLPFLDLLGAVLIPALVVMLLTVIPGHHASKTAALVAWLAGSVAALIFKIQGNLVHLVVGAVVSIIVLEVIIRLPKKFEFLRDKA